MIDIVRRLTEVERETDWLPEDAGGGVLVPRIYRIVDAFSATHGEIAIPGHGRAAAAPA